MLNINPSEPSIRLSEPPDPPVPQDPLGLGPQDQPGLKDPPTQPVPPIPPIPPGPQDLQRPQDPPGP